MESAAQDIPKISSTPEAGSPTASSSFTETPTKSRKRFGMPSFLSNRRQQQEPAAAQPQQQQQGSPGKVEVAAVLAGGLGEAGNKAETPRRSLKERLMSSYSARSAPPTPEHKPASSSADMSLPLQVEFLLLLCVVLWGLVLYFVLAMCGFVQQFSCWENNCNLCFTRDERKAPFKAASHIIANKTKEVHARCPKMHKFHSHIVLTLNAGPVLWSWKHFGGSRNGNWRLSWFPWTTCPEVKQRGGGKSYKREKLKEEEKN